jgi:outer membrane protein OmpA-like peptidoglycan-associated protein
MTAPATLLLSLTGLLGLVRDAQAQEALAGFDGHNFHVAPFDGGVSDPLVVHRVGFFRQGQGFAGAVWEWSDDNVLFQRPADDGVAPEPRVVLDDVWTMNLSGGYAIIDRVRIHADVPIYFASKGPSDTDPAGIQQGGGIGDLRLGGTVMIARGDGGSFGFIPWLDFPTGDSDRFLGNQGFAGGGVFAGSFTAGIFSLSADMGLEFVPQIEVRNLTGSDMLVAGVAGSLAFTEQFGTTVESRFKAPFEESEIPKSTAPSEVLATMRYRMESDFHFLWGGARALTPGAGAAQWRAFLGFGWTAPDEKPTHDMDGDGLKDKDDPCPRRPETINGWKDGDGCPDELAFIDVEVQMGGVALKGIDYTVQGPGVEIGRKTGQGNPLQGMPTETWSASAATSSCFAGSTTQEVGEGLNTLVVALEKQDAKITVLVKDQDGEVVSDATVKWSTKGDAACIPSDPAGVSEEGGIEQLLGSGEHRLIVEGPDRAPVVQDVRVVAGEDQTIEIVTKVAKTKLEDQRIVILDKVFFETGKTTIKSESFELLAEVANVIKANDFVKKVQVEGHTDSRGNDEFNQELSQGRAEAVRVWLIEEGGVEAERLVAVGFGESRPIASNNSSRGRAENRRVEFNIIDPPPPGSEDAEDGAGTDTGDTPSGDTPPAPPPPAPAPEKEGEQ